MKLEDMTQEMQKSLYEYIKSKTKRNSNGCLEPGNKNNTIFVPKTHSQYTTILRLYYTHAKNRQLHRQEILRRKKTCTKNCIDPEHITIMGKKITREKRAKHLEQAVLNRIVYSNDENGCWSYLRARDVLLIDGVTTMRSAVHLILKGERLQRKHKNKENCIDKCINPNHILLAKEDITKEKYLPLCKIENECLIYTGQEKIVKVRRIFNKEKKEYQYNSRKRLEKCMENCVYPLHRLKNKDRQAFFFNKVHKNQTADNCWKFFGSDVVRLGYKQTTARRASWILENNTEPDILILKKSCESWCVNPHHMINKKRIKKYRVVKNERVFIAHLSKEKLLEYMLKKIHDRSVITENGCLVWLVKSTNMIIPGKNNKTIQVSHLLYSQKYTIPKKLTLQHPNTCQKNCIEPTHAFILGSKENKEYIEKRENNALLKRIVREEYGCWSYIGATDILFRGKVTTMRNATYLFYKNEPLKRNDKNDKTCKNKCINPGHIRLCRGK